MTEQITRILVILSLTLLVMGCNGLKMLPDPVPSNPSAAEFADCDACPVLVTIPAGHFTMGSSEDEAGRLGAEGPQHRVRINYPLAIGKFEVTFDEWDACVDGGGCDDFSPGDQGWGRGQRPVININWTQIHAYLDWLSNQTGKSYRLLSEAEWEYAARAGSTTAYPWGTEADHDYANFGDNTCCSGRAHGADRWANQTAPVGSFPPNAFGLHDMHGNVYERVQDCWNLAYDDAPVDGAAWMTGDCSANGLRGGSWISSPELMRSAERDAYNGYYQVHVMGFRVARVLDD